MKRQKEQDKFVFRLIKENSSPTIENVKFPKSYLIPCIDEVYDDESGENRVIRYASGERSIYLDEQVNQDMNKRAQITFFNGYLIVDKRERTKLAYLRASNACQTNNDRMPGSKAVYFEVKPGEGAKEQMKFDKLELEAKQAAYNMNLDELIGYARVLGVDVNRDPAEVRYAMSIIASQNPETFMEGLDSPQTKRKFYVYEALDAGIISLSRNENSIRWGDSKQPIVQAPVGQDPLDYLVEFTFDSKGESVYERIRTLLTPSVSTEEVEEEDSEDLIGMSGEDLLKMAKELNLISFNGGAVMFNDSKVGVGYSKSGKAVDNNPTLKRQLIKSIEKA
jgi:hypothetical protein